MLTQQKNVPPLEPSVQRVLSSINLSVDDVFRMSREDFENLNNKLVGKISEPERRRLIKLKLGNMNNEQTRIFFQRTEKESLELRGRDPNFT